MSEIRINIIDRNRTIIGEAHGSFGYILTASLAAIKRSKANSYLIFGERRGDFPPASFFGLGQVETESDLTNRIFIIKNIFFERIQSDKSYFNFFFINTTKSSVLHLSKQKLYFFSQKNV